MSHQVTCSSGSCHHIIASKEASHYSHSTSRMWYHCNCILPFKYPGNLTWLLKDPPCYSWENPLFLWPFSIATLNYQRVNILRKIKKTIYIPEDQKVVLYNIMNSLIKRYPCQKSILVGPTVPILPYLSTSILRVKPHLSL